MAEEDKKEDKKRPKVEKHLENLVAGTDFDKKKHEKEFKKIDSDYKQLYKSILTAIESKYGKTKIPEEIRIHYSEAAAKLAIGQRTVQELYRKAEKEVKKDKIKADKKSLAKYIKDIAKYTGHPHKYADSKSDAEVLSRIEQAVDSSLGESGGFKRFYEAFKKDSKDDDILAHIRSALMNEHASQYSQTVMHDYTFDLDADQTLQFSAAHGSHLKTYGVKSIRHKTLAADRHKMNSHILKHVGSLERTAQENYDALSRRQQEE